MIVQNIGDARVLQVVRYEHGTSLQVDRVKSCINFFDGLVSRLDKKIGCTWRRAPRQARPPPSC